ncbi:MAG: hypothetical protein PHI68_06855, partial [Candidatus Cloacimonetes bacterium]|nr:hypothetical protein [Candidatus Cloacimonadota bacterium]
YLSCQWLLDNTIYEYPFYSIFTTLSLFGVWQIYRNFQKDQEGTISRFHEFLNQATTLDIRQLYENLGIKYGFQEVQIRKILDFAKKEL